MSSFFFPDWEKASVNPIAVTKDSSSVKKTEEQLDQGKLTSLKRNGKIGP